MKLSARTVKVLLGLALVAGLALVPLGQVSATAIEAAISPADDIAAAVGELGRTAYADTYAGLRVDADANLVEVFATDTAGAGRLVTAATAALPAEVTGAVTVRIRAARYSRHQLEAARTALWDRAADLDIAGIAVRPDGLVAKVSDPARSRSRPGAGTVAGIAGTGAGVAVAFEPAMPVDELSRSDDFPPYYGGGLIRTPLGRCTTAFGMKVGTHQYEITADHCARKGDTIRDGGSDVMGKVTGEIPIYDAAAIGTRVKGKLFASNQFVRKYKSTGYSYNGQKVCQSGYASNYICRITVLDDDYEWKDKSGVRHRGVVGQCSGTSCVGARPGDSGGPVWVPVGSDGAQSRGVVSSGAGPFVLWTETPFILASWGGTFVTA